MNRATRVFIALSMLAAVAAWFLYPSSAAAPPAQPRPRLEAVAETRLLMEGLAQANFRGLERNLQQKPLEAEAWTFIRGQALLIGETGNLLMIRPPHNSGEAAWMELGTALRTSAARLAQAAADKDFERSRVGLQALANTCNRCHETFRVPTRIKPFAEPPERKAAVPNQQNQPGAS